MELADIRSRIHDVLFDTNRGLPFIHSRQILDFLDRVETKFNILINDPHWDTAKVFVSKYPDLYINKDVFLPFLDDLLQVDFVKFIHAKSDTRTFEVPSSLGSPLAIPGRDGPSIEEHELNKLNEHIDYQIGTLARKSEILKNEKESNKVQEQTLQPPSIPVPRVGTTISKSSTIEPTGRSTSTGTNDKSLKKALRLFCSILPFLNALLLFVLIGLIISQNSTLRDHVFSTFRSTFFYETTDIYWWQKWSVTEKLMLKLWEYIQNNENVSNDNDGKN